MYRSLVLLLTVSSVATVMAEDVSNIGAFRLFSSMKDLFGNSTLSKLITNIKSVFRSVTSEKTSGSLDPIPEDAYLNMKNLTSKYGYDLEEHKVLTADGYILTLHRIPSGKTKIQTKSVVFLMHGLMASSDAWVIQGSDALAYMLADEGYDVWMGNARGSKHSSMHVTYNTNQADYWKFSWEEIGVYDLPAMIDYTLNYTQKGNLYYIGHSQGTTSFYVMASMKPEYNDKIKMMFSLSPVAYMGNVQSPIVRMFSPANKVIAYWLTSFNIYSSSVEFFNKILSMICYVVPSCDNLLYLIVGNNHQYLNETLLPVIFSHMPSGASTLQFIHYGQLVESGRFCRYDFGEAANSHVYQNATPPDYELGRITVPIVLFYSGNDWLADPYDVRILISKLPNVIASHFINDYNHLDFLYAESSKDLVYSKIMEHIHKVENVFNVISKIKNFTS